MRQKLKVACRFSLASDPDKKCLQTSWTKQLSAEGGAAVAEHIYKSKLLQASCVRHMSGPLSRGAFTPRDQMTRL
eukprot:6198505-Pleurochrysis_carterae.AAC.1